MEWRGRHEGFTLIEMSIVLVIIGLIVGGILVGRDLVRASEVRAQITQIEKYNTAANTFYGKYGYLPGDIPAGSAAQFGFAARGSLQGQGDGNGVIEGIRCTGACSNNSMGYYQAAGETVMFWVDLSAAGLIDGTFNTASSSTVAPSSVTATTSPSLNAYFPAAKIGQGYVYVWSGGGVNYFSAADVSQIYAPSNGYVGGGRSFTVAQAYDIDAKIDDGYALSGRVMAVYQNGNNGGSLYTFSGAAAGVGVWGTASTCYENSNNASAPMRYSLSWNGGRNINCALSFRFQ